MSRENLHVSYYFGDLGRNQAYKKGKTKTD